VFTNNQAELHSSTTHLLDGCEHRGLQPEKRWSGAEREIAEREAEVTEIGWSAERLFRRHAPLTFFDLVILATWHLDQP